MPNHFLYIYIKYMISKQIGIEQFKRAWARIFANN